MAMRGLQSVLLLALALSISKVAAQTITAAQAPTQAPSFNLSRKPLAPERKCAKWRDPSYFETVQRGNYCILVV